MSMFSSCVLGFSWFSSNMQLILQRKLCLMKKVILTFFFTGRDGKSWITWLSWRKRERGKSRYRKETPYFMHRAAHWVSLLLGKTRKSRNYWRDSKAQTQLVLMFLLVVVMFLSCSCVIGEKRRLWGEGSSRARRNKRGKGIKSFTHVYVLSAHHAALMFPVNDLSILVFLSLMHNF